MEWSDSLVTPQMSAMNSYFEPMRAHGYFVNIVGRGPEPDTYDVCCEMYITDRDEFSVSTTLRYDVRAGDGVRGSCNECIGCGGGGAESEPRTFKRGSIACPLCGEWTRPWAMRKVDCTGRFKMANNGSAEFIKSLKPGTYAMASVHMIEAICDALEEAYEELGSTMGGGGF